MARHRQNTEQFPVAMMLVAMDAETSDSILHAAGEKHWATTFFEQKEYPSEARRPSFRSQVSPSAFCVALIDFDAAPADAAVAAEYLKESTPGGVTLVAVANESDPDLVLAAMRAGCTEFLCKTRSATELPVLMDRLEHLSIQTERQVAAPGVLISLLGVKGGVGTTSVAVQLAMTIRKVYGKRTLLVDAHPELGHAAVYLGLNVGVSHFANVVQNVNRLDSELLRGFVARHSSGLDVLCSPDQAAESVPWDHASLVRALTFLRSEYEYIIVDCAIQSPEQALAVMEASAQVYLVTSPEIGAIRDLSRQVDRFAMVDSAADKLKVVLNRSVAQFAVNAEQVERAIKLPIAVKVPSKPAEMARAQNLGEPMSTSDESDLAAEMRRWAAMLLGASAPVAARSQKKAGLLSWLSPDVAARPAAAREA